MKGRFPAGFVIVSLFVVGAGLWAVLDLLRSTRRAPGGGGFGTAVVVFVGLICLVVVAAAASVLVAALRPRRADAPVRLPEAAVQGEPPPSSGGPYPAAEVSAAAAAIWQTQVGPVPPVSAEAGPGRVQDGGGAAEGGVGGGEGDSGFGDSGSGDSGGSST